MNQEGDLMIEIANGIMKEANQEVTQDKMEQKSVTKWSRKPKIILSIWERQYSRRPKIIFARTKR